MDVNALASTRHTTSDIVLETGSTSTALE